MATKRSGTGNAKRKSAAQRELIDTGTDARFVRRDDEGQFMESDDVGRSLSRDRETQAKKVTKKDHGDKDDHKRG